MEPGVRFPWRCRVRQGDDIHWEEAAPAKVRLEAERAYEVRFVLNVRAMHPSEEAGTILLRQSPGGAFTEALPLRFSCLGGSVQTLQFSAVLYPKTGCGCELSLVLDGKSPLCVERAVMDVWEIWKERRGACTDMKLRAKEKGPFGKGLPPKAGGDCPQGLLWLP